MAFVSFRGTFPADPYLANEHHILIAHPAVADTLALMEHAEGTVPYARARTGWPQAGERNIRGALTVNGSVDKIAEEWQAHFVVRRPQYLLFEQIIMAQQSSPCTLLDRFNGETDSKLVWLQTDRQYLTPWVMSQAWQLQFVAMEDK